MNPSSHSSIYTATNAYSYTSTGACYVATQQYHRYADYASGLYEDPSSSIDGWSDEYVGLGGCIDADRALFEAFLTAEVASISPSGPTTVVPMQLPPSYDSEPSFLQDPTQTTYTQPRAQPLDGFQSYQYAMASSQSAISPAFEETTVSLISPHPMYTPMHDACFSTASISQSSDSNRRAVHHSPSSSPYPSPPPELSPQTIVSQRRNVPAHTDHSSISLSIEQPPETTIACISPDLIYPSAHCNYDLEDGYSTDASSQISRASRRATHHSSSASPYPSPSPEPSPRTSSIIMASQRRNAPARTAAPVPAKTWQCPHCPYVQRNRRSPDLRRHIKTHTHGADVADWVCCGVPVLNAIELGVPASTVRDAQVSEFDGTLMLGGCRKAFSRRDALKRHLQREKGKCFGDVLSLHQRGNRESY